MYMYDKGLLTVKNPKSAQVAQATQSTPHAPGSYPTIPTRGVQWGREWGEESNGARILTARGWRMWWGIRPPKVKGSHRILRVPTRCSVRDFLPNVSDVELQAADSVTLLLQKHLQ